MSLNELSQFETLAQIDDLVQQTDWVSYEYGKVRYLYDQFGLGDKTEIEYFNGGHSMRAGIYLRRGMDCKAHKQ